MEHDKTKKHYWLYVLKLEQDKYYVGITTKTPEKRFAEHCNVYHAANWCKKYKPIKIIDRKDLGLTTYEEAEKFEIRVTRKYIEKYGLQSTRGGDITDAEDYYRRFGYYYTSKDWEVGKAMIALLSIIFLMTLLAFYQTYT